MVPAGEPWLEVEGTLVSGNFRRFMLEVILGRSSRDARGGVMTRKHPLPCRRHRRALMRETGRSRRIRTVATRQGKIQPAHSSLDFLEYHARETDFGLALLCQRNAETGRYQAEDS